MPANKRKETALEEAKEGNGNGGNMGRRPMNIVLRMRWTIPLSGVAGLQHTQFLHDMVVDDTSMKIV